MRILIKFTDGTVIDTKGKELNSFSSQSNFLQMLQDYKKDPNAVVELEGDIKRKFADIHSVELILK
jgi:hypothetical protein